MADYGGATPNLGIPYKGNDSPATIDDDNKAAYLVIDAAVQGATDRVAALEVGAAAAAQKLEQGLQEAKDQVKEMELVLITRSANGLVSISTHNPNERVQVASAAPGTKTITITL